ncbi:MAG TPA: beta-ketoacyl-ACP synthase III, partial [Chloroflexia bacterium]|nr:beta-ketoacyl-ACP synthase III [Chloroflexia bacterium]
MEQSLNSSPWQAVITGWGFAVPERILTNQDLEKMVETSDEWITTRTGIKERHLVGEGESNFTLALQAAKQALQRAAFDPAKLDLIIVGTCTPDFLLPSTACLIQDALDASKAGAFDLQAACSGFLYSLNVARQFMLNGAYKNILVIGAETITRFIDYTDRNTCVLFGDGAGAVVLQAQEQKNGQRLGVGEFTLGAYGAGGKFLNIPGGGSRRPPTHQTVQSREHYVKMDGQEVFKLAVRSMASSALEVLEREGLSANDIDLVIPHQANIRIIDAVGKRLEIPAEKMWVNIDRYGNT